MKSFVHQAMACAAFALFCTSNAHAQSIVSMQTDLSDLKVKAVSLLDGTSPSAYTVSFFNELAATDGTGSTAGLQSVIWRGTPDTATFSDQVPVASALLPTESVVHSTADGLFLTSITPTSISLSTTLTEQALQALASSYGPGFDQRYLSSVSLGQNSDLYGGALGNANAWRVTLAPQSQLTLSGVVNTALSMDVGSVSRVLSPLADSENLPTLVLAGGASFSANVIDPDEGGAVIASDSPFAEIQYFFDTDRAYQLEGYESGPAVLKQNSFTLTLVNDLAVEKSFDVGLLAVNELITVRVGNSLPIDGGGGMVPEVPEPSTYALMGLGLVGLTVVARQRRAKQAH